MRRAQTKLAFLFLLGIGVFASFTFYTLFTPTQLSDPKFPLVIKIPPGSSVNQITDTLVSLKLISYPTTWKLYLKITRKDRKLQSGTYLISENLSPFHIAELLSKGKVAVIKITIPEGLASWEIFELLGKDLPLDTQVFNQLMVDESFLFSMGISSKNLEGFLFPDTYQFPYGATEKEILATMVKQFQTVWASLPKENSKWLDVLGPNGIVTLASIVQKEALVNHEMKDISGVFTNRLEEGWPLGADPTVRFYLRKLTGPLYKTELTQEHPYNTRLHKGLPPGPIANPGKLALEAALFPHKHQYLFFVAKSDGSGEHYFSVTHQEHIGYKEQRLQNQTDRGAEKFSNY